MRLLHCNLTHTEQMMLRNQWVSLQWHLIANGFVTSTDIPLWVQIACACSMGLGTSIGGWKIIKTVGGKIMKIRPINGVAADLTGAFVIFGATFIHLPVSTTHVISSGILRCWLVTSSKRG